jgi:hypothetical protein
VTTSRQARPRGRPAGGVGPPARPAGRNFLRAGPFVGYAGDMDQSRERDVCAGDREVPFGTPGCSKGSVAAGCSVGLRGAGATPRERGIAARGERGIAVPGERGAGTAPRERGIATPRERGIAAPGTRGIAARGEPGIALDVVGAACGRSSASVWAHVVADRGVVSVGVAVRRDC